MQNKFTQKAQNTLTHASAEAADMGHAYVGSEHLLLGLTLEKDSIAARLLFSRGINHSTLKRHVLELVGEGDKYILPSFKLTPHAKHIIEASGNIAAQKGCPYVGTEHLLSAILSEIDSSALKIIEKTGVSPTALLADLSSHQNALCSQRGERQTSDTAKAKPRSSLLSQYTTDMTELARLGKIDPTIGRESETQRMIQILSRRTKNNPCLIGEPGVGKTAVVEGLAQRISNKEVPKNLLNKRILCLDIPSVIAGAKYRGEFEERMKSVMAELSKSPEIIVFIDELHTIVGAGAAEGALDAANILKPSLARGGIRLIGATTPAEYKKYIEKDAALERRLQAINVEEPTVEATVEILTGLKDRYETHHGIRISDEAINAAARLSHRYIPDRFLPDKAVDVLDESAAKLSISAGVGKVSSAESSSQSGSSSADLHSLREEMSALNKGQKKKRPSPPLLEEKHVAELIMEQTGIPASRLCAAEGKELLQIEERLGLRVVGQEAAISAVASALRRSRAGVRDPNRPMGSFIFVGPSGVGKTELALAVAEELHGSKASLIRLDMSEYMEKHSVSRLIGPPPGYVGYGEGGILTDKIRKRPFCVLLLDEIEKAHPEVCNLLLQVLEDGRLTDSQGRQVSFCNTVIIMTSNAGASDKRAVGFSSSEELRSEHMLNALKDHFKPELLNRIDKTVVFSPLSLASLTVIAQNMLDRLRLRTYELGYEISFDNDLAHAIAKKCSADNCGARNIRRYVTDTVEDRIALEILSGNLSPHEPFTLSLEP